MSSTRQSVYQALREIRLIDPHTHINPHQPASSTLADILGYHYYTELVHSAGTPKQAIESPGLSPRELVRTLVKGLPHLSNTAQHAWLIDICQRFFGFEGDVIDESNWEVLFDAAESTMRIADWADVVLEKSNVEAVFLTNDFDDNLSGFDTKTYIPCLRTDDLVFHLSKIEVRDRLAVCSGIDIDGSLKSLRDSIEQRFEHFVAHGARACAISLPPDFSPCPISDGRASTALEAVISMGTSADASHKSALAKRVFWTIVELCDHFRLPMDLMIGVNRGVYQDGVHQGRDLYDSRVSLIQYRELFNAFPDVKFPISVLASVTNQELVSYAWIFPNVITNGHWWYSNTPSFIRRDAAARLEAVPRNKQIGYYSDAYKLEFIAPKFDMYRNILAGILTDDFVIERGWSEEKAIDLGRQILRGNVDVLFPDLAVPTANSQLNRSSESFEHLSVTTARLAAPMATVGTYITTNEMPIEDAVEVIEDVDDELLESPTSPPQMSWDEDTGSGYSTLIDLPLDSNAEQKSQIERDSSPFPWMDSKPVEKNHKDGDNRSENEFVALEQDDDNSANTADVYSTLELSEPWSEDRVPESASEPSNWFIESSGSPDEVADEVAIVETLDPTLESTTDFAGDDHPTDQIANSNVRYFRADDEPIADDAEATNTDTPLVGLYSDPSTGELTWPPESSYSQEDDSIEGTYLLPDEPIAYDDEKPGKTDYLETSDFDELEFTPIEDDDSALFPMDEDTDEPNFPTPDQTILFEDGDQTTDVKKD
jgi:glucuronate isomerase